MGVRLECLKIFVCVLEYLHLERRFSHLFVTVVLSTSQKIQDVSCMWGWGGPCSVYILLSWTIWEMALISCRMRSAISEPGSQVGVRPRWLFFKAPHIWCSEILQNNESLCDIINKPASCYTSHKIRKAYVPFWSPDWSLICIDENYCFHHWRWNAAINGLREKKSRKCPHTPDTCDFFYFKKMLNHRIQEV